VTVALVLVAMVPPSYRALAFDADASRVWTTQQAYEWTLQQIPKGSRIGIETRELLLPETYEVQHYKQLRLTPVETYRAASLDYLIASSQSYGPYLNEPAKYPVEHGDYVRLFREFQEVARFGPSRDHPGPEIRVLKVKP
jgi:hypothetical protein